MGNESHYEFCEQKGWKKPIGYFFYYEKAKSFIIELCEELDEWEAPLLFQGLVNKGIYTVPADISLMWVKERIIPSGRQNLAHMVNEDKIQPIISGTKENLYVKGQVEYAMSE